jgi:apolipoprotein N-acyltransferase
LALAAGMGAADWLRGNVLSGFPWNPLGMAFGGQLVLGQTASILGVWGLTLLAGAILASPATLADPTRRRSVVSPIGLALIMLLAMAGFGLWRLSQPIGSVANVKLRVMQPNLPQDAKFRPENRDAILKRYLDLSDRATSPERAGVGDVTHLFWPESAFPFILARDQQALAQIGAALRGKTTLLTGAARADERGSYYNSIQVVAPTGQILDSADKVHLVPFGEYLPLSGLLHAAGLTQFVHIPGGFTPGPRRVALKAPGLPTLAPLICYEAIFSGEVLPQSDPARPGALVNVSNDAWFGRLVGPAQHFAHARLRSIEEGLPMIRAANSGISAVVDPYGRIVASLPVGVADVIDAVLPQAIAPPIFTRLRHWGALGMGVGFALVALASRRRKRLTAT